MEVVESTSRNGYMVHAENILLGMPADENKVRSEAVSMVRQLRQRHWPDRFRGFRAAEVNLAAQQDSQLTEVRQAAADGYIEHLYIKLMANSKRACRSRCGA